MHIFCVLQTYVCIVCLCVSVVRVNKRSAIHLRIVTISAKNRLEIVIDTQRNMQERLAVKL